MSQRSLRRQFGFLVLLAGMSGATTAETLPPFRVDPALLGLSPTPSAASPTAAEPTAAATPAPVAGEPQPANQAGASTVPAPSAAATAAVPVAPSAPAAAPLPATASSSNAGKQPVLITADRIDGTTSVETVAEGNVDLVDGDRTLKSDRLVYREAADEAEATGNVKLTSPGEAIVGPRLKMKLSDDTGTFDKPAYSMHRLNSNDPAATAHGKAASLDFKGKDHYHLTDATYSTCPVSSSDPDWFARTSDLALDYTTNTGVARNATVVFKGVPIMYSPWLSFTLDNQRKTGFLAPTIGSTSKSGLETTLPFYWNIAPNMDATIAPRYMAKRGTQWNGEFRYLEPGYSGQIAGEYLPDDHILHESRSLVTLKHEQNFGYGFSGSLDLNRVSDDAYFTDLSTRLSNITQTNLLRQGVLSYGASWWSASLMAQRYQTLQDPSLPPVSIPYDRLPQLLVSADRPDLPWGTEGIFSSEYVNFSNPTGTAVEGKRTTLYPQLALPIQGTAYYVTPKIGFRSVRYQLTQQAPGVPDQISVNVPIFSVDSGVVFERPLDMLGQSMTQTLEPRLYYLRVPSRDQSQIPIFDTGLADFNFAQIFSENIFSGGDRIANANQLTAAVTSRLIDSSDGEELLRGAIGQRYYFDDQTVTIPGIPPRTSRVADFLGALSGRLSPHVFIDSGIQYDRQNSKIERLNIGGRYQPEPGKVLNAGYRYTDALLRQIDASAQWPLFGGWHAVGRYNYSLRDKRLIESIAGLEYDGGCWATRFVVQRLATAVGEVNNSIFVQLELNGFSDIGSNPLNLLKRNIPGYGRINQQTADPVFADH